jgi:hypothetical protein
MNRRFANWPDVLLVRLVAGLFLAQAALLLAVPATGGRIVKPTTITAVRFGVSKPLREINAPPAPAPPEFELKELEPQLHPLPNAPRPHDSLVQRRRGGGSIPAPGQSFDGVGNVNGVQPADTTMDVSPNQILDWVNLSYSVYDRSGNLLKGPLNGTAFWTGLGGPCETFNGGDVLVRWDQFAGQWFVSQLAYPGGAQGCHQCVAVSRTSDATGSYYQYDFLYSPTDLNDYPKMGLWSDPANNGYYITVRNFINFSSFSGMKIIALDRISLLTGSRGVAQIFDVGALNPNLDGLLPADLRGPNTPPNGSRETYIGYGSPDTDGSPSPVIHLFQTHVDFSNPANSKLTQLSDIAVGDFDPNLIIGAPQVGGNPLETLPFSMYRADYRVFENSDGSINHDSLLLLHDVNVASTCGGNEQGGERWHEVQHVVDGLGSPTLYQEGTYGPCDGTYRWMGSVAQDASGNIALGFSASSDGSGIVKDPSVHYTGRLVGDALGDMSQGEGTFLDSTSHFTGSRWGDYSTIIVDPVDQCTFWYTTMYGKNSWATRIGSFKFPSCTTGPTGTLEGTVTDASNGNPIGGAMVTATGSAGSTSILADAGGHYSVLLPVDTYGMTVTAYGYFSGSAAGVGVTDGGDTVQDFPLDLAPQATVSGTVSDGSGEGWPLYAKLVITASGAPTFTLYTDPLTGVYTKSLVAGTSYNISVSAAGYNTATATISLVPFGAAVTQDFSLTIDTTCKAPGYNPTTCQPGTGGLVVGNVYAANTNFGFNGARVAKTGGSVTTTFATPDDPNQNDGFYILFAPPGIQTLHASLSPFAVDTQTPTVVAGSVIRQDFSLRFLDVPDGSFAYNYIYGLAGAGIAAGCGVNNYCPDDRVTRAEMAVFIEKGAHGTSFVPPACVGAGLFGDVPCPSGFAVNFIEALAKDGIAAGCAVGPPLLFCPDADVTRSEMAVFIERGIHGSSFVPPACSGIFTDVPCPSGFAVTYIEALSKAGIAAGCGGGNYCPDDPVTRAQMAVFIDKGFNVPHP